MYKNPTFSIIIIGFNTEQNLKKLLGSLKNIIWNENNLEIIYIDDGSYDNSLSIFKNYNLKFQKKYFGFTTNMGRVFARNKGVELSTGDWILFINSNVVVEKNIISKYHQAIKKGVVAIGGTTQYETCDFKFQNYLNHSLRGVNRYQQYDIMKPNYLLFGNCLIKRNVFKKIIFNVEFKSYGGEELEFAYRLNNNFPNQIIACKDAIVTRLQHPSLISHCNRLEEFGQNNFKQLNQKLKISIIKYKFLLMENKIIKYHILIINKFFIGCYKRGIKSYKIIQIILLTSILKGFYVPAKQPHSHHSQYPQ